MKPKGGERLCFTDEGMNPLIGWLLASAIQGADTLTPATTLAFASLTNWQGDGASGGW